jgi:DNA-binding phage protein
MNTDPAASLTTLEALAGYLAAAFESGDATVHLAAAAGLPQAELRHAFATGEMSMAATLAIMKVIDLHMPGAAH